MMQLTNLGISFLSLLWSAQEPQSTTKDEVLQSKSAPNIILMIGDGMAIAKCRPPYFMGQKSQTMFAFHL
jgi:alkaline phosphatase